MEATTRSTLAIAASLLAFASPARAQMGISGASRPLGGYGAATIASSYTSGGGSVPYMANGGGVGLVPAPRASASMGSATPIGGSSALGTMGQVGMRSLSPGRRVYGPLLPAGGMGSTGRAPGMSRTDRIGLGFGSPFRQPPSLGGPSAMGMP